MKTSTLIGCSFALAIVTHADSFRTGQSADGVIGQPNLTTGVTGPVTANRLRACNAATVDPVSGKIFVADTNNSRILRFANETAMSDGLAEAVIGQPDFTSSLQNNGGLSGKTLSQPTDLCVDQSGTLWVADESNNRVLGYFNAATRANQPAADIVFGQADFSHNSNDTVTAQSMDTPQAVMVDANGVLWVADSDNNRVLRFNTPNAKASGAAADVVLGEPDFVTNDANDDPDATLLREPTGLAMDSVGRLWVGDRNDNRVLFFNDAANKVSGAAADGVLGQPDFTTVNTPSASVASPNTFLSISGVAIIDGDLLISDQHYNRVLVFRNAATVPSGASASLVLGQNDFESTDDFDGADTRANGFDEPMKVHPGPNGGMLLADSENARILHFTQLPEIPIILNAAVGVQGKRKLTTSKTSVTLRGSAANAVSVEVKVGKSGFRAASGTSAWSFKAKLKPGKNSVLVVGINSAGTPSSPQKLTIIRK